MKWLPALLVIFLCSVLPAASAQLPIEIQKAIAADATPLTAEAIMSRVAANQDRTELARKQYVYHQHIHVVTKKTNGKLMREETSDYYMVPQEDKTQRQLERLTGKYWGKGKYVEFSGEPAPNEDSLDASLVNDLRDDLVEPKSKDGIGQNLVPFATDKLSKYVFHLVGHETFQGHDVYRISFMPADKKDIDWAGEAYIDATDFEPIYAYTKLSRQLPFAVRTLLGTDLPGVGYSLHYEKQPGGAWFPKSYGTEFTLHVLFFFNREVMVSLDNKDFQQTHVETKITADAPGPER
jgi:hypothetical protein